MINSRKIILLFILLFMVILYISCGNNERGVLPRVENGILNLENYSFDNDKIYALDGEWELYWNKLLDPVSIKKHENENNTYMTFPGVWNESGFSDKLYPKFGYATFKLNIILKDFNRKYGLYLKEMNCSYKLWINGKFIASNGVVSRDKKSYNPQFLPQAVYFNFSEINNVIILQIANYSDSRPGSHHSIKFGFANTIHKSREYNILISIFILAMLFIMGLYHISLFLLRKDEIPSLYFGFFCLLAASRILVTGESLLYLFFKELPWVIGFKFQHFTLFVGFPLIVMFINSLYSEDIWKPFIRFIYIITGISVLMMVLFPPEIYTVIVSPFQIILVPSIIYINIVLFIAAIKKREMAIGLTLGYSVLVITVFNDILYDRNIINTTFLMPYGTLFFLVIQSAVLSLRFSSSFNKIEHLSIELAAKNENIEDYNLSLEKMVEDRTRTVRVQKEELENQIKMAKELQRSLLPDEIPHMKKSKIGFKYEPMMDIGGDFLDYYIKNNEIGLFICDVSGHGVDSALLASMVKMSLDNWKSFLNKPGDLLREIKRSLHGKMGEHFVTASACHINLSTGELTIASAGHPPVIILKKSGDVVIDESKGRVIVDHFEADYSETKTVLDKGDKIILYTDGVFEIRTKEKKMLGEENFINMIKSNYNETPLDICQNIFSSVIEYSEKPVELEDDITIMVFEYTG